MCADNVSPKLNGSDCEIEATVCVVFLKAVGNSSLPKLQVSTSERRLFYTSRAKSLLYVLIHFLFLSFPWKKSTFLFSNFLTLNICSFLLAEIIYYLFSRSIGVLPSPIVFYAIQAIPTILN